MKDAKLRQVVENLMRRQGYRADYEWGSADKVSDIAVEQSQITFLLEVVNSLLIDLGYSVEYREGKVVKSGYTVAKLRQPVKEKKTKK